MACLLFYGSEGHPNAISSQSSCLLHVRVVAGVPERRTIQFAKLRNNRGLPRPALGSKPCVNGRRAGFKLLGSKFGNLFVVPARGPHMAYMHAMPRHVPYKIEAIILALGHGFLKLLTKASHRVKTNGPVYISCGWRGMHPICANVCHTIRLGGFGVYGLTQEQGSSSHQDPQRAS